MKYYLLLIVIISVSCRHMKSQNHTYTNALIHETSPYLLQHAHNPVDWHAWNAETLEKAKRENKLLIISIGYSACHWCHVMEHESFEDTTVAQLMNDHFIPIKVDREERPDVDDIYMSACQIVSGRGGWPLNAFALPDGRPVWAGTYFPKDNWINILKQFREYQANEYSKLVSSAESLTHGIASQDQISVAPLKSEYSQDELDILVDNFIQNVDFVDGGRRGAPKFPMPNNWEFLLTYLHLNPNDRVLEAINTTLSKMAQGGIYDQVGGGFARYSTDAQWLAPHFEKMLYDNGQLVSLYSHAYRLTGDPLYKQTVEGTLQFVERELLDDSGGFYSALDADSEGEEGKYYVWDESEIDALLTGETERNVFKEYYSVTRSGNWEHKNILMVSDQDVAKKYNLTDEALQNLLSKANKTLLDAREQRVRPGLDDKILNSWNGLMLKGYVDAYAVFQDEHYLDVALKNAAFIKDKCLQSDGSLHRNYKNGRSTINAFLDDYATVIEAYIALYQATLDRKWLELAKQLTDYTMLHFYDANSHLFFYTSDLDAPLVTRKKELSDNVISASNSIMAHNLLALGTYYNDKTYLKTSKQMMSTMWSQISTSRQPSYYSNWCRLYTYLSKAPLEVVVMGQDALNMTRSLQQKSNVPALYLGSVHDEYLPLMEDKYNDSKTTIYVCQDKVCQLPVYSVEKALELMRQ